MHNMQRGTSLIITSMQICYGQFFFVCLKCKILGREVEGVTVTSDHYNYKRHLIQQYNEPLH